MITKPYILFFVPASQWTARQPEWHADHVEIENQWVVGELDDDYITMNTIDASLTMHGHYESFDDALAAFRALVHA